MFVTITAFTVRELIAASHEPINPNHPNQSIDVPRKISRGFVGFKL